MADIEIEIDGQKLTAKPNQTVIQVADDAGIYIPRFCYHKQLSIPANCRMCLVDIEKAPKPMPACATPVAPGMKVSTKSQRTISAQRAVMEFLLINHPLDCPICDQGGECELQDLAMGYGSAWSHYDEAKRSVADLDYGPLIASEMTRCIYCTRCVRFGDEIAGLRELGVIGRGEFSEVSTYVQQAIHSEVSGNIIDLCPVGALTSKPYRFTARPWELDQKPGVSPHDCVGSNLNIHTRYGKVMRVVSRDNMAINQTWIADRDRFSYTGLYHPERLEEPMARIDGKWQAVEWEMALELVASRLQAAVTTFGADKLGALASPNATLEEFYLLQKLVRGLGSPHIDHRLRRADCDTIPQYPPFPMPLTALATCDAILLIGSHISKEQPIAALSVRKAALNQAAIFAINAVDYRFIFPLKDKMIVAPHQLVKALETLRDDLKAANPQSNVVQQLKDKQKVCVILGTQALQHPHADLLQTRALEIAELTKGKLCLLPDGANSAGGDIAGAVPHQHAAFAPINHAGLNAHAMLQKPRKAYVLLNVEPDRDCANAIQANAALMQADFVVALSMYRNEALLNHADVILPIAAFTETAGTYVNAMGEWQSFTGVAKAFAASRPAWKVLRVLGNFLKLPGFEYKSAEAVKHEVRELMEKSVNAPGHSATVAHEKKGMSSQKLSRVGEVPIYSTDSLVRRAEPLTKTQTVMYGDLQVAKMHPKTAKALGLSETKNVLVKQHGGQVRLPLVLDEAIAEEAVWVPGATEASSRLGDLFGEIEVVVAD